MIITAQNGSIRSRYDDRRTFELMKEAGFSGVDFSINTMRDFDEVVMSPEVCSHAEKIRRISEDVGLPIIGSHAPYKFKHPMAMDETEPEFCRIVRSIEFAGALGAPFIVVHALRILPEDRPEDVREEQDRSLELNLRWYRVLQPYAKNAGVKIAVENLCARGPQNEQCARRLGDARSFVEILDLLDPEYFTGCFDVGHANLSMGDPASFIREAGKYIHHLHVHDNDGFRDLHIMPAFRKLEAPLNSQTYKVDWKGVAEALRDIHYDGTFNYEIGTWFNTFSDELLPEALALAVKAALPLVRIIDGGK